MENNNLLDELFNRISLLKQEQENLNKEISLINKEISNQQLLQYEKFWSKKETNEEKKELNEQIEKLKEFSEKLSKTIEKNISKIKIIYKPFDSSLKPVYISGDFNDWSMIEMNNEKEDTYSIELDLEKGFNYLYCFYSNGNKLVDYDQPLFENNEGVNNIINLPNEKGKNERYNYKNNNKEKKLISLKTNEKDFVSLFFNYNKILNSLKNSIIFKKTKYEKEIKKKLYESESISLYFSEPFLKTIDSKFIGRIIVYNNIYYQLKSINIREKFFRALRLYDSNGIACNYQLHETIKFYLNIPIDSLFINSYFLSQTESEKIMKEFENSKSILKLYYQIQNVPENRLEKIVIPYKVIPDNIEIAQYDIKVNNNQIKEIIHRESNIFVKFESFLIGEMGNNIGLVASSTIKVYTTLYNKDILNILHLHLNDTSQEITIDSEFLEKNDNIIEHKHTSRDAMGKLLTYKLLFKEYKLIKIYYFVNDNYIDEPNFEEIRFNPNGIVKILNGEYKDYFGKIKQFPLGMLARKNIDKNNDDNLEIKKMKSFGYPKIGICKERSLEELPGFLSIEVMFLPGHNIQELKEYISISIPCCDLYPLSAKEQIKFEKNLIMKNEIEKIEETDNINKYLEKAKIFEELVKDEKKLEEKNIDDIKEILKDIEDFNNIQRDLVNEEMKNDIEYIKTMFEKLRPLLVQRMRILSFNKK